MADLEYKVVVDLSTKGSLNATLGGLNKSYAQVGNLRSALNGLGSSLSTIANGVRGVFEGAVEGVAGMAAGLGKIAAVGAFAAVTYGATKLNDELEKTQMSLATIFNANGLASNMEQGMGMGAKLMADMRKDAAKLPGEFSDLVNIFQMAASTGFAAGLSPRKLEEMSAQTMAAAAATGVSMPMAARELSQLLAGRSTVQNVLGQKVFGLVGAKSHSFNKMGSEERTKFLIEGLQKFQPAIETFNKSFDAISSTFKDNAKYFLGEATKPLFERIKSTLGWANRWFDGNKATVNDWAIGIGQALTRAFDYAKEKIKEWAPVVKHFALEAFSELKLLWARVEPFVSKAGSALRLAMGNGGDRRASLIDSLERVGKLYAASKIAGGVMGAMPNLGSIASMAMLAKGGGGAAGGLGLGGLGLGAGGLLSIGAALSGLIILAGGAASAVNNTNSMFHKFANEQLDSINHSFSTITGSADGLRSVLEGLGAGLLLATNGVTTFFTSAFSMAEDIRRKSHSEEQWWQKRDRILNGGIEDYEIGHAARELPRLKTHVSKSEKSSFYDELLNGVKPGAGGGGGGTHIGKIEITVSSNQDPSRIARLTVAELAKLNRNPKSSRYVTNFSRVNT